MGLRSETPGDLVRPRMLAVVAAAAAALAGGAGLLSRPTPTAAGDLPRLVGIGPSRTLVNVYTTGNQYRPQVGMDPSGQNVVIAWDSLDTGFGAPQDGSGSGVYARAFDSSLMPLGDPWQVNTETLNDQNLGDVVLRRFGGQDKLAIAYDSFDVDGDGFGSRLVLYTDFVADEPPLDVNTMTAGDQNVPDAFFSPNLELRGGVCFEGAGDSFSEVFCRSGVYGEGNYGRADADRQLTGTEFQVNQFTTGYQGLPSVCGQGHGDFVVAWASYGQHPSYAAVFARRANVDTGPIGDEFKVNDDATVPHGNPHI